MADRIQKVLAAAGLGSRRHIESLIKAGRVRVNDQVAQPGDKLNPQDRVSIDRRRVQLRPAPKGAQQTGPKVLAYYKPQGEICTAADPQGRRTVFAGLPKLKQGRWLSVGRLDLNTSGLLLFTNDGALANRLMHPRHQVEREYAVRVLGQPAAAQLRALTDGVPLEDGVACFKSVSPGAGQGRNRWYQVTLTEGRNREVRRLWESQGLQVNRLIRIRYGACKLPRNKRPGQYWELSQQEIDALLAV
ncbi:MAG: pseudouridine synthase [Gammaproteobacteria bacterium]|nr:pseudouridine synthase [Gammaproteobacteria bacterium]MCY4339116.1 pseudouridine synthase [Gammaproteobacteria bacterium]